MTVSFGLALDFASPERTLEQQLDRYAQLIHQAERYGFDSVSAGESYPTRPTSGHLPSPLLALAALAPRTRLRLGTGVTLLPAWHPLRLAQDAAVLDQISGGRVFLGVGVGGAAVHRRFGRDPERIADFVDDGIAMLRALWAGEDGYQGKYLSVEGGLGVRPLQVGGPPMLVGGALRRSVQRAARWGEGYIASSNYSYDRVAQQAERYRAALSEQGKESSSGLVVANRLALLAETEAEARDAARTYVGYVLERYARMGSLGDPNQSRSAAELFDGCDVDYCLVGTPAQVVQRVRRYADAGVTGIQARVCPGEIPPELAARTIELLGQQVLPEFR